MIDLKDVQSLSRDERQALYDFVQYLSDYMLLLHECLDGITPASDGAPILEYRGLFIENVLTRQAGKEIDRSQLDTLGIGLATARFG